MTKDFSEMQPQQRAADDADVANTAKPKVGMDVFVNVAALADDGWHGDVREGVIEAENDDGTADIAIRDAVRAKWINGSWTAVERY